MTRSSAVFSCIILAFTLILNCRAGEFKIDHHVLGKWVSVDFVTNTSDFNPDSKSWSGDLYLKEFEFKRDGTTHMVGFTWTKGVVHFLESKVDGKYEIKTIDGTDYLFLEWMSGDVTLRGEKPSYYVFKRNEE